jgi:metal-sulfur cluster biosynthetic enzyme
MTPKQITEDQVVMVLKTIYDPELPVNIYELGLIYFVTVKESLNNEEEFFVNVVMTVTSPNCPAIESLPEDIVQGVEKLESVIKCDVEVTFDPPWDRSFMSEEAQLELGFL